MPFKTPTTDDHLSKLKSYFGLFVGGSILSIVVSYGTVKFKQGDDARRLTTVEAELKEFKERRDRNEDRYATKEYIDLKMAPLIQTQQSQNSTLREILDNVRRR
jgi:hypothetical protein